MLTSIIGIHAMTTNDTTRMDLIRSINLALGETVRKSVHAVWARHHGQAVEIRFVMDEPISEDDRRYAENIVDEVGADLPGRVITAECLSSNSPAADERDDWLSIYLRRAS